MAESSVIGAGTVVSGHIRGEGSLEILGRVEGDVNVTGDIVVGGSGRVRGNISGSQLTIAGHVQGDLRGTLAVLLEHGARVAGDIVSPRIGIAPGALARGHVQTEGEPAQAARSGSNAARVPAPVAARAAAPAPRAAAPVARPAQPAARVAPIAVARVAPARPNPPIQPSVAKVPARAEAPRAEPARAERVEPARAEPRVERRAEPSKHVAAPVAPPPSTPAPAPVAPPPEMEFVPVRPIKQEPRRPPPPVVPVLGKGVKAKKKRSHD